MLIVILIGAVIMIAGAIAGVWWINRDIPIVTVSQQQPDGSFINVDKYRIGEYHG